MCAAPSRLITLSTFDSGLIHRARASITRRNRLLFGSSENFPRSAGALFEKILGTTSNADSLRAVITRFYRDEIVQLPMTFFITMSGARLSLLLLLRAVSAASSFDISTASSNGLLPSPLSRLLGFPSCRALWQREGEKAARTLSE